MTILETLLMYRIHPTWILFKHKATAELTHFPEKCWVFHESWFPKITTLGKLRSAMLWTSSTFSLPKSPENNQRNMFKQSEKDDRRTITKNRISSYVAYVQSEWQDHTEWVKQIMKQRGRRKPACEEHQIWLYWTCKHMLDWLRKSMSKTMSSESLKN